jgi:hypothetical protein
MDAHSFFDPGMNRFIRLMLKGVIAAALVVVATSCSLPRLGQRQSANQVGDSQEATQGQPANRTRVQRANQPTTQAQNNNQQTAQAPDATVNPEATGTTESDQAETNEPVSALW